MAMSGGRRATEETTIQFVQHHHHRQQLLTPDIIDTVEWHCYSAPQSRSGSFKKPRRTGLLLDAQGPRSSLPSLEDSISAKLLELQQLEADDCRVVREFVTSERGGIVNRGDSFRRNRDSETETTKTTKTDRQRQTDTRTAAQQATAQQAACKVLIIGDRGVGKTSLLHQLMTSDYMAAMNTCNFVDDGESEKTMSVLVDDVETLVHFIDVETASQQKYERDYSDVAGFILVYSVTDRNSYQYVSNMLSCLQRNDNYSSTAVILAANKTDLVRKRQVDDREAKDLCSRRACKFISISAILNHRVDDLLVGIVCQIRLHRSPRQPSPSASGGYEAQSSSVSSSQSRAGGWLQKLLQRRRHKDSPRPCENLFIL